MKNPWEQIPLNQYESHMKLESVMQLQTLNKAMKKQFDQVEANSVMILGIAGGNGLEHIDPKKFQKVYGVDVNRAYLEQCEQRYPNLKGCLECRYADLTKKTLTLPHADLVIANLLIEYIGYECYEHVIEKVRPKYVSCIIQINGQQGFVSDSPYLSVFDSLQSVHHQIQANEVENIMTKAGYHLTAEEELLLPNGKKLVQLDFIHKEY